MSAASSPPVVIEGAGALCSVGRGLPQVYASVRAGMGRSARSPVHDRFLEPITMALFPDEELAPLVEPLTPLALTARQRRMLRLSGDPLREAMAALPPGSPPPALFLGLPEARPGQGVPAAALIGHLATQAEVVLDAPNSQAFPRGRAGALLALEAALAHLARGRAEWAIAGGVDTYLDLVLLADLDEEQRILGPRVADGFVPGEGAAFVLLTCSRRVVRSGAKIQVIGAASAVDPGHRYSDKPARGEGLAAALAKLDKAQPRHGPIATIYAGFNGESFGAKEWGVARLRHGDSFAQTAQMEHPADCFGDAGAATGALLLALAQADLGRGARSGPALVFVSSDREDRACALLDFLR
jgi:3-oxoacyl-[acyl-carrier-protein] synthase I